MCTSARKLYGDVGVCYIYEVYIYKAPAAVISLEYGVVLLMMCKSRVCGIGDRVSRYECSCECS